MLSLENLMELVPLALRSKDEFTAKLCLIREIADWNEPLKPAGKILRGDIQSYAMYGKTSGASPFARRGTRDRAMFKLFWQIFSSPTEQVIEQLNVVARKIREDKLQFKTYMDDIRLKISKIVKDSGMHIESASHLWKYSLATQGILDYLVESHARHAACLEGCKRRGLRNLLRIRSVYTCLAFDISFVYDLAFRKRQVGKGDPGDQHHVIYSSVADVFICEDRGLRSKLIQIPKKPVAVVDIDGAINRLLGAA